VRVAPRASLWRVSSDSACGRQHPERPDTLVRLGHPALKYGGRWQRGEALYVILRNEANFSECWTLWISLWDNVLAVQVCHFDTWLRFAGNGFVGSVLCPITRPFGPRNDATPSRCHPRPSIWAFQPPLGRLDDALDGDDLTGIMGHVGRVTGGGSGVVAKRGGSV